ncbi:aminoglycoside phosphotransferase family protein [Desulfosediminicola ganghwensis]|uniref:aminoglycoside phosphotransferase family protein n=1 Tax=Desulfosediminicola ganghwensis TaxID=2569540 RepID=UPI0010AD9052|nr:aminoglycoside phosphotransferase family protein [Desulfosediminicola ganghwensis]
MKRVEIERANKVLNSVLYARSIDSRTCTLITAGTLNLVYRLGEDHILKLYILGEVMDRRDIEMSGFNLASSHGAAVPLVLAAGCESSVPWLLTSLVGGKDLRHSAYLKGVASKQLVYELGRELKKIHKGLNTLRKPSKLSAETAEALSDRLLALVNETLFEIPRETALARTLREARTIIENSDMEGLDYGILHGDYQDKNIVTSSTTVRAVLDFENIRPGLRHQELVLENIACYIGFSSSQTECLQSAILDGYGLPEEYRSDFFKAKGLYQAINLIESLLSHKNYWTKLAFCTTSVNEALDRLSYIFKNINKNSIT